jgi:prophage maintenance system killer protein
VKNKLDTQPSIVVYQAKDGSIEFRGDFSNDTVWATQAQIAKAFSVDVRTINEHLKKIYKSKELLESSTFRKFRIVQNEGGRRIERVVNHYNLDAILSVGYRVNSKQATQFRIWATKTLREYIVKGIAINTDRIKNLHEKSLEDLKNKIKFIQETIRQRQLDQGEVDSLLSIITDYANSWANLQKYDEGKITLQRSNFKTKKKFTYDFVRPAIDQLKSNLIKKCEASDLFGNERDGTFDGILKTIYQTFGGQELYGSLEEKAAHLLYFIIKDHPFSDGNKRIGAFLFVLFLDQNRILFRKNGERKINDNALVAVALLVAESNPKEKEQMVALITQLLK